MAPRFCLKSSVAHGTAYDIAGSGVADDTNLIKAMIVAPKLSTKAVSFQEKVVLGKSC
jgi:4-hydroxy-L-threonine phosphate dehydrogenase PdxA